MILLLVFAIHLKIQMFLMNISSNQILKLLILGKKRQNFQSVYKIWKVEIGNLFLTEIENMLWTFNSVCRFLSWDFTFMLPAKNMLSSTGFFSNSVTLQSKIFSFPVGPYRSEMEKILKFICLNKNLKTCIVGYPE